MINERIYLEEGNENVYLDVYVADRLGDYVRDAILIIPGGGFYMVSDIESEPVAMAFMPYGFNAFVLNYSVTAKEKRAFPAHLIQASLAMKHIKDNAQRYNIDPDRVFVNGFSAGGHIAGSLGILWHKKEIYDAIDMPYGYNKPAGMMLNYPLVTGVEDFKVYRGAYENLFAGEEITDEKLYDMSLEKHVSEKACPLFLFHTSNDNVVNVKNSLSLASAYVDNGLKFELHVYPGKGNHGVALANEMTSRSNEKSVDGAMAKWVENAVIWSKGIK